MYACNCDETESQESSEKFLIDILKQKYEEKIIGLNFCLYLVQSFSEKEKQTKNKYIKINIYILKYTHIHIYTYI